VFTGSVMRASGELSGRRLRRDEKRAGSRLVCRGESLG
jgi:hypothetical protein